MQSLTTSAPARELIDASPSRLGRAITDAKFRVFTAQDIAGEDRIADAELLEHLRRARWALEAADRRRAALEAAPGAGPVRRRRRRTESVADVTTTCNGDHPHRWRCEHGRHPFNRLKRCDCKHGDCRCTCCGRWYSDVDSFWCFTRVQS